MINVTDNEIIKALKDEIRLAEYGDRISADASLDILKDNLNLIDCQKAEIEKLERARENLIREVKAANCLIKQLKTDKEIYKRAFEVASGNSIKEFAERIKDEW